MNLTLANKNPFSTFDFLGYFFPGALFIGLLYLLTDKFPGICGNVVLPVIEPFCRFMTKHYGMGIAFIILSCYVTGHLLSYISSVTIELFYTWCYGYPTKYLLKEKNADGKKDVDKQYVFNSQYGKKGIGGHIFVCLIIFPITMCHFILERFLGLDRFIKKGLPKETVFALNKRMEQLSLQWNFISPGGNYRDSDIHRFVMHYVYEHCQMHQIKFDNYVALYGFLRSLSFTFCVSFILGLMQFGKHLYTEAAILPQNCMINSLWVVIVLILLLIVVFSLIGHTHEECRRCVYRIVDISFIVLSFLVLIVFILYICQIPAVSSAKLQGEALQLVILFISTYISYLGFAKFYRRFTLENFMALLTCDYLKDGERANLRS